MQTTTKATRHMTFPDLFECFARELLPPGTPETTRKRFQGLARYVSARAGDAPLKGNGADQIVFVATGATKLVAHASQGREQVVAYHFAGDLVSVPARAAHAYSLCALEDCELVYFPADEFFELAHQDTGMLDDILKRALKALSRCREKTISLGRKTAQEKLASFLVTMAERVGAPADGGWFLTLPMSRRDIGDSLGLTIETVSRQLRELRELGLLETVGRSGILVRDLKGLNARAGHLPEVA